MSKAFHITPGRYVVPHIGEVDTRRQVSDDKAFAIYQLPRRVFPWIRLGDEAESYLRKQKLKADEVAALITRAETPEEVELLAQVSDTKTVARAREARLETLEYENPLSFN